MAVGWAGDSAVQDQIQDSINDEIRRARACLPQGVSLEYCEECGDRIPEARRKACPACVCACIARKRLTGNSKPFVCITGRAARTASCDKKGLVQNCCCPLHSKRPQSVDCGLLPIRS